MQFLIRKKHPVLIMKKGQTSLLSLKELNPTRLLVLGYFITTLLFTGLLMLPISSANHQSQGFIDALFVATSGISTTGLTPVVISRDYSLFGQIVLMADFQVGGIGYMAIIVWLAVFLRKRLSLKLNLVAKESLAGANPGNNRYFFRNVIALTLFFELTSGFVLAAYWARQFPILKAIYFGLFHSISAFCTAGFSLFPDSLVSFQTSLLINSVINITSLFGAIGFFVLFDLGSQLTDNINKQKVRRLLAHTRLAIFVTLIVLFLATVTIFFSENWPQPMGFFQRFVNSTFQAISASTTDGFNTINVGSMSMTSLFTIILLMFIGASPGSTGGGIKTTTLGVLALSAKSGLQGQENINFFKRRIPDEVVRKSHLILFLFILVITVDLLVLSATEKIQFLPLFFEIISALSNSGLSMGVTSSLSWLGKFLLSMTMLIGRVGPVTIGLASVRGKRQANFQYAEAEVFVG